MRTLEASSAPAPTSPAIRSPWHSPVPYLFGGLAAMLGLIAFALLILACSYWRLSGYLENRADSDGRDLEAGEGSGDGEKAAAPVLEEKFLVIMAGEEKPTFIATAISSRASSFGSKSSSSTLSSESSTLEKSEGENEEKKQEDGNVSQVQMGAVFPQGTDQLSPN
ncbi:protein GLUTAMINE DUMPER 1-like [Ipomoea triloba]|uniref:protein GLUTAMINE DUMPER 1-like n=1 Tax=Ipomoea triloba TaxID=35885 RepID=UPI00125DF38E|nr:protein GLUTAMINE DUMPER 1-like [Ipomoea triloba]